MVQQYREILHTTPDLLSQWLNFPRDSLHLEASWLVTLGCFPHGKDTFVVTGIDAYPRPGFMFLTHCVPAKSALRECLDFLVCHICVLHSTAMTKKFTSQK